MTPPDPDHAAPGPEQQALQEALARLLASVARLAVARGVPFAGVEEMLKQAFVDAASAAHPTLAPHRRVSRISTATGINRREVTRLTQAARGRAPVGVHPRSLASEVFAHWRTQHPYRDEHGEPRRLPRQGPAPSFETLAQEITRDVHPRSLLEELTRLGLAELDVAGDTVNLVRDAYVPSGDRVRMLGFLGDNVGDHLQAAVDNVLGGDRAHFEQAVFADGLSPESMATLRPLIAAQWQSVLAALVPHLEALVAADAARQPAPAGRVRVGLYSFQESMPAAAASPGASGEDE
jgi:hypothetical protein